MKRLFIFALVATLFAACSTDPTQDLAPEIPVAPDELYVSFDEEDTRVQLGENGAPVWNDGDLVSVFYRSNAHDKYEFTGETGDTNGTLRCVKRGTPTIGLDKVVAVYPYNENYRIEFLTGNIQAFLPAEQTYAEDSYGIGSSIMISSSRTDRVYLKNVCGWLKLQFTGADTTIKKIVLRGNNGEQLAGNIYITADDASCTLASDLTGADGTSSGDLEGTLVGTNTIITSVTLNCGDGIALNSETPTAFYIALPPQTFKKGITVTAICDDGTLLTTATENAITVERNHILPMASVEIEIQLNNEIWYTSSDGKVVTPNATDVFGATIVSNTYENGKGIIKFNGNVTEVGYCAFYECKKLTSITIPNSATEIGCGAFAVCSALESITIPNSVTSIGEEAFPNCSSLTSITIPDSVTEIGDYTFYGCSALESVTIPNGVTEIGYGAFYGCSSLTSVTIPDSVTEIGDYTFYGCSALESVTIPNGVTEIGYGAFYGCSALESVTIPDSVTTIGEYAFDSCSSLTSVTIPDSVTTIGYGAFYGCSALESVTIPDSVTTIGEYAFDSCSSLTSVTIPDSVTTIGESAFSGCFALESVTIPDSVTSIGNYAFAFCEALTSVTIGDSVTSIGDYAFYDCSALKSVTIGDSVTMIGYGAFHSCSSLTAFYGKFASADNRCLIVDGVLNAFAIGCGLTEYTIPDSVASIESGTFAYCSALESITIPNSVTLIGNGAFYNCKALKNITIGNGVTTIESSAFAYCSALESITIPNSVTLIGSSAFDDCSALKEVYCKPTTPPIGDVFMFSSNASGRRIYVPTASVDAYKAATYWDWYADAIEPYEF